jgi:hypothetical protein
VEVGSCAVAIDQADNVDWFVDQLYECAFYELVLIEGTHSLAAYGHKNAVPMFA